MNSTGQSRLNDLTILAIEHNKFSNGHKGLSHYDVKGKAEKNKFFNRVFQKGQGFKFC